MQLKFKLVFAFIFFSIYIQAQNYTEQWKKVEDLEKESNYKAAFKEVSKIEKKAIKEDNQSQKIKSLLYIAKYNNVWVENYEQIFFNSINKEIKKAKAPYANWLNYIAAKTLRDYYTHNQYKISSKANSDLKNNWNLKTWDKNKFNKEITNYLENSIENTEIVKNIYLKDYEDLIDFSDEYLINNERNLFDFFASNYNSYYNQNKKFSSKEINTKIENSYPEKAFWRENLLSGIILDSVNRIKESHQALMYSKSSSQKFSNTYIQEKISLKTIVNLINKEKYNNKTKILPELVEELKRLTLSKNTIISESAKGYLENITTFKSSIDFPYQSASNKNFIGVLNSKNANHVYIDIYKTEDFLHEDLKYNSIKNAKPFKSFDKLVKNNNLHTYTKKEIIFPALPVGKYYIVVRNEKDFNEKSVYEITELKISDIHLVSFKDKEDYKFQILDGKTGNINTDATLVCNGKTIEAKNNFFSIPHNNTLDIKAIYKADTLNKTIYYYKNDNNVKDANTYNIKFYTDRNLYEPGEKVQFKLIAIQQNKDVSEVLVNQNLTVYLINASSKKIDSLTITTNTFGSGSGTFMLPKNSLNGKFTLKTNYKEKEYYNSFKVEEFKIPTFEIKIDPISKSINPTDSTITITGKAIAFAGNPIQNATGNVTYKLYNSDEEDDDDDDDDDEDDDDEDDEDYEDGETVINATDYKEAKKIKNTITFTTDNEGKFIITLPLKFNKISEDDFSKWNNPEVITYNLNFDILDKNGEKQIKSFSFKTSPRAVYVNTSASANNQTKELEILLNSKDINNIDVQTKVVVDIYEIQSNVGNKITNNAQTQNIDDRVSSKEFQDLYPELEYESVIDNSQWKVISKTKQIIKESKGESLIKAEELKNLKQGWYKIVSTYTKDNTNYFDTTYVFKTKPNQQNASKNFLDANLTKQNNKLVLKYNSEFDAFNLHQIIFVDNNIYQTKNIKLNKGINTENLVLNLKPGQNVEILTYGFLNNNVINIRTNYQEPKEDNKTEIKVLTFRDKITPNSQEQWKLKINTNLSDKSFEVLAALHNKALDKIYNSSNFNTNLKNNYYNDSRHYLDINNLVSRYNKQRFVYKSYTDNRINFQTTFDKFNWFNFNINTYTFPNIKWQNEYKNRVKNNVNEFTIKGVVLDDHKIGLPGVSITVKGKRKGTSTDINGKFEINVTKQDVILFEYVGLKTQEFKVEPYYDYIIYLKDSENSLQEVVFTAYESRSNNDEVYFTSPEITTGDRDSGYINTLQGNVAGLNISSGSGSPGAGANVIIRGKSSVNTSAISATTYLVDGVITSPTEVKNLKEEDIYSAEIVDNIIVITTKKTQQKLANIKARETKEYTGFFFPHIETNTKGEFNLNFTAPQSSAGWKLRLLAHNKQGESTSTSKEIITQKQFMVQPNWPTFIKETDKLTITTKIVNLENTTTKGKIQLQMIDSKTQKDITNLFAVERQIQDFSIQPNQDQIISWQITVPKGQQNLAFKIVAFNDVAQDGELLSIPVISNTQIVEKANPIWVNPSESIDFNVEESSNQTSKISITNNVNALILQTIPYVVKGKTTTSTELYNKIYAQIIGNYIISNNPELKNKIKQITPETRAILKQYNSDEIENTPWNLEANSHQKQLENLAVYLHPDDIENQILADLQELKTFKLTNGLSWLRNGIPNYEITFDILSGLGEAQYYTNNSKIRNEIQQLAEQIFKEIDSEVEKSISKKESTLYINTQSYIYARSFYKDLKTSKAIKNYIDKNLKSGLNTTNYNHKAKLAILYFNNNQKDKAQKLLKQIKAAAVIDQSRGMYFKANTDSYYQNQIETQANIIKAFKLVTKDDKTVQSLTNWLIYNKSANHWTNKHQTTIAIGALASKSVVKNSDYTVKINGKTLISDTDFYNTIDKNLNPEDKISIKNHSNTPIFGGIYSQAEEQIQNITPSNNPEIQLTKQYFINQNNKIKEEKTFKTGDLITVKLTITTLQNQNFVVLTDNRISTAIPEEQISENKSKLGLNYYQTNNAANTKFYITNLPKGTHVIEYNLRATHNGQANTGITTIESMYAPQIKANTNSIEIKTLY